MIRRVVALAMLAACGGRPTPTPSPASGREVRLLEADDPQLSPVLFAVAKHFFDPDWSRGDVGFSGVYVDNRLVPSLTKEIAKYINPSRLDPPTPGSGVAFTSVRIAADTAYVEIRIGGRAGTPWCVSFVVDQMASGWLPVDAPRPFNRKPPSKAGQCGK